MNRLLPNILFALLPTLFGPVYAQGLVDGFMKGKHKGSVALTASQESFDSYYVGTREVKNSNLGTVTTQAFNAYASYGLDFDLDLIVNASLIRAEASAGYWQKQEGPQDVSAALRWEAFDYKIGKARLSWLFAVGYSLPMQNYVIDSPVAIGHGSKNLDGRTLLHLKAGGFFLTGQYGYIRRSTVKLDRVVNFYDPGNPNNLNPNSGSKVNVPDVTELIIRSGFATKYFYVDGWWQRQTPYSTGTDIGPGIPFPTNAIGFTRAGATLYVPLIKKFGVTANYSTTLDGRNVGNATRVSGGVVIGI